MNTILKTLITVGIVASSNLSAMAKETTPDTSTLQNKELITREEGEATTNAPSLQDEVENMKQLRPAQLAEKQRAMHEAMQKMTPAQREEMREEMREELNRMSPEERKTLHDQGQTEEEKLLERERIEHSAEPQQEAAASAPVQSSVKAKSHVRKTSPNKKA